MTSSSATAKPIGIVSLAAWLALGRPDLKAIGPLVGKFVAYVVLVVPAAWALWRADCARAAGAAWS